VPSLLAPQTRTVAREGGSPVVSMTRWAIAVAILTALLLPAHALSGEGSGVENDRLASRYGPKVRKTRAQALKQDLDNDGVPDKFDECPGQKEDLDDYEDQDGCPELDNDEDRIPDVYDTCPLEAEDIDGFEDADGCPDPDNDGDGILDVLDGCPNLPEDFDGFEDLGGCPDPDNDRDGIRDDEDTCPDRPERWNRYRDRDGCPD